MSSSPSSLKKKKVYFLSTFYNNKNGCTGKIKKGGKRLRKKRKEK